MQISARHLLKGRVKQVTPGAVNTEVTIELPGGTEIVSIITKSSAERLQVSQGKEVYAIIKSSDVMLATE
jgi:molybdopterin-binding protein